MRGVEILQSDEKENLYVCFVDINEFSEYNLSESILHFYIII